MGKRARRKERWEKASDIPLDEEDVFQASRDQVLLDGNLVEVDDGDEDEVFGLKGVEETDDEGEVDDDEEDLGDVVDEADVLPPPRKDKKAVKAKPKLREKKKPANEFYSEEESESDSQEETWGRTKAAYFTSKDDHLDSEDEEANERHEQEARRLQAKSRDGMVEADFGLEDPIDFAEDAVDAVEPVPKNPSLTQDKKAIVKHLEKTSPETLALARDWEETVRSLIKAQERIAKIQETPPDSIEVSMAHLRYQALLTYATTLSFYLHLRASGKHARRPDLLQSHPILSRLLTLKQSLSTLDELNFSSDDHEGDEDGISLDSIDDSDLSTHNEQLWRHAKRKGLEDDELAELLQDAGLAEQNLLPRLRSAIEDSPRPQKKRKPVSSEPSAFDLQEPIFQSSRSKLSTQHTSQAEVFGEMTSLHPADAADKQARKKSLRFHAWKIESTSARRQGARANAMGGDDDIPYRGRKKELRVSKNRGMGGEDLDDVEPSFPEVGRSTVEKEDRIDEDGGYYEYINRQVKERKEKKKTEHDDARAAERLELMAEDNATGPRAPTRTILANKGLTPHRSKVVRNPRVKKRQRFEKAQRKVSSQKAVYKGGIEDINKYQGEKSGITKVVKSVKLG